MVWLGNIMENIHGVDVSWIHNTHNRDSPRATKAERANSISNDSPRASPAPTAPKTNDTALPKEPAPAAARPIPQRSRISTGTEKAATGGSFSKSSSPVTSRRNSWLSSISSKFSSSPGSGNHIGADHTPRSPVSALGTTPEEADLHPAGPNAPRHAVLPQGQREKAEGTAPYTPVPTKPTHPNFLASAFRRLSSSGGQLSSSARGGHGGICERMLLNVDRTRERCQIPELDQSKLRRVAFCVDVEIASRPRYNDEEIPDGAKDKAQKKKMAEKSEGEALKHPTEVKEQKETGGVIQATGEHVAKEPEKEAVDSLANGKKEDEAGKATTTTTTKKKEKKKRNEGERKARREKKRRLAEDSGSIPVELTRNDSDSSASNVSPAVATPRSSSSPTTDPLRIYRRCCQLRETPILKKITEQLAQPSNGEDKPGIITRLDLTDSWLQLSDLVTLGDYLAVVPVKELIMENCGLTDEGIRVILAGLLAVNPPGQKKRKVHKLAQNEVIPHHGFVQRVVFKNNPKVGRDGWRHISLFINMSRSLKCLDVSMIQFPQPITPNHTPEHNKAPAARAVDPASILSKAIATRLAGPELELLNMAETKLTTPQIGVLIDGIIQSGLKRLGLAGNNITPEGMSHIARYLKDGKCEGLDLGGNDLSDLLDVVADSLDENHPLFALSLANCDLTPDSLLKLFPALIKLRNFRFVDLSHNHDLFDIKPSAVYLLRKYLPKMPVIKRIHLSDCAMSPEQAIALAEIFPDAAGLAHVSLLENPKLSALANATDEANQEEACALYASLMAAVRVSKSLICIDIDVPSPESSEVVKALAKQVVAYSLHNMERGPVAEIAETVSSFGGPLPEEKEVDVPEVLVHLVGRGDDDVHDDADDDEPTPDEDYVIGGTGVVKALGICLKNRSSDSRPSSVHRTASDNLLTRNGGKAKEMSKNLLGSARKIRARLQPALLKEARTGDRMSYNKLLFLDQTLERMIKRFEDEYPETRLPPRSPPLNALHALHASPSETSILSAAAAAALNSLDQLSDHEHAVNSEDDAGTISRPMLSRHNSDVSLASRALSQEEGRMHRFGQKLRRDIISIDRPAASSAGGDESAVAVHDEGQWEPHLDVLRGMMEEMGGEEMKRKIEEGGQEALLRELGGEASVVREKIREKIIRDDPEGWGKFEAAARNAERGVGEEAEEVDEGLKM